MFKCLKIFLAALVAIGAYAQDVIFMRDGKEVQALVLEVGLDAIKYKKWHFQEGPYFSVPISKVFMIKHRNGDKDVFEAKESPSATLQTPYGTQTLQTAQPSGEVNTAQSTAPTGQRIEVKQPPVDADYEKRQKSIVKYLNNLEKMENALKAVQRTAPASYEVGNLSVELLKTLNRTQEQKYFELESVLPLIIKATLMTLPSQAAQPIKAAADRISPETVAKVFPFLTVEFKLPQDRAVGVVSSAIKSWNGKSIWDIKGEMQSVPPMDKVKVGLVLKNATGIFATAVPQLKLTVKSSL